MQICSYRLGTWLFWKGALTALQDLVPAPLAGEDFDRQDHLPYATWACGKTAVYLPSFGTEASAALLVAGATDCQLHRAAHREVSHSRVDEMLQNHAPVLTLAGIVSVLEAGKIDRGEALMATKCASCAIRESWRAFNPARSCLGGRSDRRRHIMTLARGITGSVRRHPATPVERNGRLPVAGEFALIAETASRGTA